MLRLFPSQRKPAMLFAWPALLLAVAGSCLIFGAAILREEPAASEGALRNAGAHLVSIQPLPPAEGEACQWLPASATMTLRAALRQQRAAQSSADAKRAGVAARKPARIIRDPYSAYSSVAVDPVRNEIVLTDENLFTIAAYDRLENTPPQARMSEPKRLIGGLKTKIEFQCGIYIDPQSGDLYAVNNDTVDTLVIFSRNATGDVPPDRELRTPHGTFGIAADEAAQELFLTIQHSNAVVVFRKNAQGDDAPIRLIQGNRTQLADPHGIALDPKSHLIFVTNHGSMRELGRAGEAAAPTETAKANWPSGDTVAGSGEFAPSSITIYPSNGSGDIAPIRVISGPRTQLDWPAGIAVAPDKGELYVANDMNDSVLVFNADAEGDVAPLRVLQGPKTLIKNPTGIFLDTKNNELWVANFGNHNAAVYRPTAQGDTPPLRVIRSAPLTEPSLMIGNPGSLAYDSKREQILVPN